MEHTNAPQSVSTHYQANQEKQNIRAPKIIQYLNAANLI